MTSIKQPTRRIVKNISLTEAQFALFKRVVETANKEVGFTLKNTQVFEIVCKKYLEKKG